LLSLILRKMILVLTPIVFLCLFSRLLSNTHRQFQKKHQLHDLIWMWNIMELLIKFMQIKPKIVLSTQSYWKNQSKWISKLFQDVQMFQKYLHKHKLASCVLQDNKIRFLVVITLLLWLVSLLRLLQLILETAIKFNNTVITFPTTQANLMKFMKEMKNNYSTAVIRNNHQINLTEKHYSSHHNSSQIVKIFWMNKNRCKNKGNKRNCMKIKRETHLDRS